MTVRGGPWTGSVIFIVVTYALSCAISLIVWDGGGYQGRFADLGFVAMFLPALGALIASAVTREEFGIDWRRLPVRYVPVALLLIPVTMHAVMLPRVALAGPLPWQEWLTAGADGLYHSPDSRGWGVLARPELAMRIAMNAVVGVGVVSVLALFEEIGWRGWLLPRLIARIGVRWGIIATSIIWGVWHMPFALSGVQHVDGVSPWQLALGMPLGITASGLVIGWLWVRTESIWIVAIAHGALNNWGQYAFKYMQDFTTPDPVSVFGSGFLGLYAVGALLLWAPQQRTGARDQEGG